jgi:hypothetical protein
MFKGKSNQKQELTGFDILLAMASELRDADTEYASLYLLMLEGFLMPQEHVMFGHQAVARSELHPNERMPATIVRMATEWALDNKKWETLKEVGDIGARMAVVWPRFLISTADGHPELRNRSDTPEADAVQSESALMGVAEVLKAGQFTGARSFIEQLSGWGLTIVQTKGDPD